MADRFAKELSDGIRFSRDALNGMFKYDRPGDLRTVRKYLALYRGE